MKSLCYGKYFNFCLREEAESDGLGDAADSLGDFSTYIEQFLCMTTSWHLLYEKKICAPKMSWLLTHSLEWASQIKPRYE